MAGRIESYLHSDKVTPNKGGVMVKVTCQTDFAARTDEFIAFSKKVARMAYAYGLGGEESEPVTWTKLVQTAGYVGGGIETLETERAELSGKLREKVAIEDIVILTL